LLTLKICSLSFFKLNGATYKSQTRFSGGGVGRNIAEGLQKLNGAVKFLSAFGDDNNGVILRETLPKQATQESFISKNLPTANCAIVLDKDGDCKLCIGDMSIHEEITPELVKYKTRSDKKKELFLSIFIVNLTSLDL
jgi:pseudouridylate synthase / pseudouridine kinase